MLRVLLTNDDGIHADGLQALRRALAALEDVQLAVIAPDENMSATARSITTRRPLWVTEVPFDDGTHGYSCDGTPVDCVRLASLGLVDDFEPDLVVAGINHGSNLGDDITYSGTVAAALEGIVLGVPGIAVSQQSQAREMDFRLGGRVRLRDGRRVHRARGGPDRRRPAARGHAAEHQRPGRPRRRRRGRRGSASGSTATPCDRSTATGELRRRFSVYGDSPVHDDEEGTDLAAVAAGWIAVTPLHFDLTAEHGMEALRAYDLAQLLAPAAEEIAE